MDQSGSIMVIVIHGYLRFKCAILATLALRAPYHLARARRMSDL